MTRTRQPLLHSHKLLSRRGIAQWSNLFLQTPEGRITRQTYQHGLDFFGRWKLENFPIATCLAPFVLGGSQACVRELSTKAHKEEGRHDDTVENEFHSNQEGDNSKKELFVSSLQEISLRKTASPFLMLCHPDKIPTLPHTKEPKEINLKAVQSLNGFIDTVDQMVSGLSSRESSDADDVFRRAVEAVTSVLEDRTSDNNQQSTAMPKQSTFGMIEFMVPSGDGAARLETALSSSASPNDPNLLGRHKNKDKLIYTRRAIQLRIPSKILWDIHESLSAVNRPEIARLRQKLSDSLKVVTLKEIVKLLKAAGLPISYTLSRLVFGSKSRGAKRAFREMNVDEEYQDCYEEDEEEPAFAIDWDLEMKRYEEALKNYDHDIATLGVLDQEVRLREDIIAGVVSRVRYKGDVSGLDQLITLRRITMLLQDNFKELQMEGYLRLWQNLIFVLEDDGSGVIPSSNFEGLRLSANTIRKRRMRKRGNSGFTFALLDEDLMVVTVPLSFKDEDFVNELSRHLYDFDVNSYAVEM